MALVLLGLVLLAGVLRGALAVRGGLWRDEGLFLFVTGLPSWGATLDFLRFNESHPPLFYALMRGWQGLAGPSDGAAVALPVLFGVALVPAMYWAGDRLFSRRVGLVAAVLAAISPILTEYSVLARPYSLLPLLALLSCVALVRGLERGGWRVWAGYVLATAAMVYVHNWPWLFVAGQWAAVALVLLFGLSRPRARAAREFVGAQAAVGLLFLPWVPTFLYQAGHGGHSPKGLYNARDVVGFLKDGTRTLLNSTVLAAAGGRGWPNTLAGLTKGVLIVLVVLLAVAWWLRRRRERRAGQQSATRPRLGMRTALLVLFGTAAAAWSASMIASVRTQMIFPRTMAVLAPLVLLVLAQGLDWLRARASVRLTHAVLGALCLLYALAIVALFRSTKSNARELAAAVAARTERDDLVLIVPEWLASSFNRYYTPAVEQIDYPSMSRLGATSFIDLRARVADPATFREVGVRLQAARAANRRVWLVMDDDNVRDDMTTAQLTGDVVSPNSGIVGQARAEQLRRILRGLYGAPDASVAPTMPPRRYETLRAFLYAPPTTRPPSGRQGS